MFIVPETKTSVCDGLEARHMDRGMYSRCCYPVSTPRSPSVAAGHYGQPQPPSPPSPQKDPLPDSPAPQLLLVPGGAGEKGIRCQAQIGLG